MALKFKAKLDLRATKKLKKKIKDMVAPLNRSTAQKLGKSVVAEMKSSISKGRSPIKGRGAFEPYRGGYRAQISKRGSVSVDGRRVGKKLSPVNLKLTGKFLKALKFAVETVKTGSGVVIGFSDSLSINKEDGHRKGANKQAKRPIIPNGKEQFNTAIQKIYLRVINKRIRKITKRS